ncbi:uncharacterized protein B0H18DRAFT_1120807 [Fomitopsis serialis]|uniref:uncharacterized protein n=1 Tax=Fomitopsis serialis TaxID=139415 RepID=UPI00200854A1|nr:uncharacterized protein B0H18DRAFT_1120807 [Neoantrodia serialis]KAH9922634.1 hypothetical protein B0H18DRAFT_1120807 [Neoantrodia serialis]
MIIGTAVGGSAAAALVLLLFILCRRYGGRTQSPRAFVDSADHGVGCRQVEPVPVVQADTSVDPSPTRKPRMSLKTAPHGDPPVDTEQPHTTAPQSLQPPGGGLTPRADSIVTLEPQITVGEDVHLVTERDTLARQIRDGEQHVAELRALQPSAEGHEDVVPPADGPELIPLVGSAALSSGGNTMIRQLETLQMEVARLRVRMMEAENNGAEEPPPAYEEDG